MSTKSAAIVAAVNASLAALILVGLISLTADQLAGIGLAVNAVVVAIASIFDPKVPWYGKTA